MSSRTEPNDRRYIMVRTLAFLSAFALATLLSACCPEDPFIPTRVVDSTIKHPAFLRIVHAAADAPPAAAVLGGAPFRGSLPYLTYQTGVNEARYYPADTSWKSVGFLGNGTMLATSPIAMEAGAFYTAYLHGKGPDYRVLVTRDTVEAPAAFDQLKVRVVNLAPDAPPIDITFSTSPNDPVVRGLAYGTASPYSLRGPADLEKPGIHVSESATGDTLLAFPAGLNSLFGRATMTLVISGQTKPSGNEPLLSLAAFFESSFDAETGLYGFVGFRLSLTAIRLINLVQSPAWQGLDLSFYDRDYEIKFGGENQGYRRNYPGQYPIKNVPTLIYPEHESQGYFLQSAAKPEWRYRIERTSQPYYTNWDQIPISSPDTLRTEPNQRYTVVVYGPDTNLRVGTAEISDNVQLPGSSAQTKLRFFHGGYGALDQQRLRLRVGATTGPLQSYGESPTAQMAIDGPAGLVTLDVVDESGAVVESSEHTLEGGVAHTVFLAPRADGSGWIIRTVADQVAR